MPTFKYLIIGGGVAGVTAAETIRANDAAGTIAIVSDEPYLLYSRVMLSKPYFFLGKVPFDQVWLKGEHWYKEKNITFLGGKTVSSLDTANKKIGLTDGGAISYEKLLIATGTATRKSTVPGADKKGVHYLRSLEDGKGIMADIKTAKNAVTVGGGFIGFEMADLMQLAGLKTTVVLREPFFWDPILDEASGTMIESAMKKAGVNIIHSNEIIEIIGNDSVKSGTDSINGGNDSELSANGDHSGANDKVIDGDDLKPINTDDILNPTNLNGAKSGDGSNGNVSGVILKDGTKLPCEVVIFGIGTESHLDWVKASGVGVNRGIVANEFMETSAKDVWTAGDIAEYKDLLLEENVQMGNWVSAHEQGRVAGLGMIGVRQAFKFVSFYTTQGFGLTVAFVGDPCPCAGRAIIPRGSPEINSYARIILVNNEIEGATLLNRTQEMGVISKLIEQNVDVSAKHAELADPNFDLKQLLK